MTVLLLSGKPVDYRHAPKPTDMVQWSGKTTGGKQIRGSFRTICWLDRIAAKVKKRFGVDLQVIQSCYNTGVAASAGTHDFDACLDVWIPGVDPWIMQKFFRANGAGAYYRRPPLFGNHIHLFVLPEREGQSISDDYYVHGFKVGVYVDGGYGTHEGHVVASSQLSDYYEHKDALASHAHDPSWFPQNIEATIYDHGKYVTRQASKAA